MQAAPHASMVGESKSTEEQAQLPLCADENAAFDVSRMMRGAVMRLLGRKYCSYTFTVQLIIFEDP